MRYHFKCRVTAKDCWILYMQRIYHSMVGVCSLILAASIVALTVRFWGECSDTLRVLLVIACLIVPCMQPLGVYTRSKKQVRAIPEDLELKFSDRAIFVTAGGKAETIPWKKVRYVLKERNMVILVTSSGGGYMLTDTVLGEKKEEFYQFAASCIS